MVVMDNVSRPLIALLLGSVAFFALWMIALKPSPSGSGSSGSRGSSAYQSAIAKAHGAVATSNGASVAHGGTVAGGSRPPSTPAAQATRPAAPAATPAATTHGASKLTTRAAPATTPRAAAATPKQRRHAVEAALRTNKVLALLFYNGAAADDRAVRKELAAVPVHKGHVVTFAVPLSELAQYTVVTNQVPVTSSPTLVLIDRTQHATTIVGFADRFEIAQRVQDALGAR
jgi:hypothetical protein